MSDDFDFDDDEDIDLDDDFDGDFDGDDDSGLASSDSDVAPIDEDDADDDAPAPGKASKPYDPNAPVPFFKNWIWWVSLIAAVPAGFLAVSMVLTAIDFGAQWNWVMVIVAAMTFICACAALVTPLLLALGFMLGGKEAKVPAAVAAPSAPEEDLSESVGDFDDDDGGFEDDDDDMFDEDEEEDDFDF